MKPIVMGRSYLVKIDFSHKIAIAATVLRRRTRVTTNLRRRRKSGSGGSKQRELVPAARRRFAGACVNLRVPMPAESAAKSLEKCPHCGADHGEATLRCPETDIVLPLAGRLLAGKFRLVSELGRGGMGAVWLAHNVHVERDVAIKLILPEVLKNPEIVARFRDEARVAARIGHAGICDILDFELTPLGPVIVMELLRGENLGQRISRERRLPVHFAVGVICHALVALEAAHRAGIIHRDLKPENLFLHQTGAAPMVVKLMDFGISKFTDRASALTASGVIMGTPEYMAPEQIHGAANADARTDIWAIGAVLYKALTGEDAFTGHSVPSIMMAIISAAPTPIAAHADDVPPELAAVILRCLEKAPDARYQSARELAQALAPFADAERDALRVGSLPTLHSSVGPYPLPAAAPVMHTVPAIPIPRSRWPRTLLGLTLLGVCCYGTWRYASQRPDLALHEPIITTPDPPTSLDGLAVALDPPRPVDALPVAPPGPTKVIDEPGAPGTGEVVDEPGTTASPSDVTLPDVADPVPESARLIAAAGHVTPSVAGKPGNQHWAKEYCEALDRNKYLGVDRWKLANPTQARLFAGVAGIKPGGYWTTANHKGLGLVVSLPRGRDRSVSSRKTAARPLCIATQ